MKLSKFSAILQSIILIGMILGLSYLERPLPLNLLIFILVITPANFFLSISVLVKDSNNQKSLIPLLGIIMSALTVVAIIFYFIRF